MSFAFLSDIAQECNVDCPTIKSVTVSASLSFTGSATYSDGSTFTVTETASASMTWTRQPLEPSDFVKAFRGTLDLTKPPAGTFYCFAPKCGLRETVLNGSITPTPRYGSLTYNGTASIVPWLGSGGGTFTCPSTTTPWTPLDFDLRFTDDNPSSYIRLFASSVAMTLVAGDPSSFPYPSIANVPPIMRKDMFGTHTATATTTGAGFGSVCGQTGPTNPHATLTSSSFTRIDVVSVAIA